MATFVPRGYYAILDVRDPWELDGELARAEELLAAGPGCLQLRAKRLAVRDQVVLARALAARCQRAGVPFCVNDRLDVALAVGADAVHVGQDDLPLADLHAALAAAARQLVVGVSTHSLAQARAAAAGGADYIGFGPVFPTRSKERPDPVVGLAGLAEVARAVALPVVAIGGITRASLADVIAAGAAAAAVIGDIDAAPEPALAAREVAAAFGPSAPRGAGGAGGQVSHV